jgi:hypothetical protein
MNPRRGAVAALALTLTLVSCGEAEHRQKDDRPPGPKIESAGTSKILFSPCCRLPMLPGLTATIPKDLLDTYQLDITSKDLQVEIKYSPPLAPRNDVSGDVVRDHNSCAKIVENLARAKSDTKRINFVSNVREGAASGNNERIITFDITCTGGGCRNAAQLISGVEIPAQGTASLREGCTALTD